MGPRAGLDGCGKSHLYRGTIPGPSSPQRVAIPTELSRPTIVSHTPPPKKNVISSNDITTNVANYVICGFITRCADPNLSYYFYINHSFISIPPLEAVLAGTRAQSCDRYGSGTLHPGQVLGGSLPLLSSAFRRSHFRRQVPVRPQRRERS